MAKLLWKQTEITGDAIAQKGNGAAGTETQPDAEPCTSSSLEAGNAFWVS